MSIAEPLPPTDRTATRGDMVALACVALAMLLAWARVRLHLEREMDWDAANVYLPMARRLLDEGVGFFARPESVRMPPLAYAWPALLGAGDIVVRTVNATLFPALAGLGAAAAWTHSRRSAVIAAFAIACSPLLPRWMADVMTESPFLLFVGLWLVAVARIACGAGARWTVLAAVAFALASLTRPAASLFAPIVAALFAFRAWRVAPGTQREIDRRLALAHAVATAGWLAWLLHNAWQFHFAAIASGAGTALWHGLNPLTDGFDAFDFGLFYDEGTVARDMNHLDMAADRILGHAAMLQLADLSLPSLASLLAHKAVALLFLTPYDTSIGPLAGARAWRVVLVVLAVVAVLRRPRSHLVLVTGGYAAYMFAAHLPLLFTLRYSAGALEVPLAVLAAVGATECVSVACCAGAAFVIVIGMALGLPGMAQRVPGAPRIDHARFETLWQRDVGGLESVRLEHARRLGPRTFLLEPGAAMEIDVRDAPRLDPSMITLATFDMALAPLDRDAACEAMRVGFRPLGQAAFDPAAWVRVLLESDGVGHTYPVGTTDPLHLVREGVLRLEFECPVATRLEIGTIRVNLSARGPYFYDRMHPAPPHAKEP
jgi:hypothetical protein